MENIRNIEDIRKDIDAIDTQLLALFERRMACAHDVARYKEAHHLPVLVPEREKAILSRRLSQIKSPELLQQAEVFINTLLSLSRDYQEKLIEHTPCYDNCLTSGDAITVAYQGVSGAYGHQAALECFPNRENVNLLECKEFKDVFHAISRGSAKFGVVPIENSTGGSIDEVYDLLGNHHCYIVAEHTVQVNHCLLGLPDAALDGITNVYSHPQGLIQCAAYLSSKPWIAQPYSNTAAAASFVSSSQNPAYAAIASEQAANAHGLKILQRDIQDSSANYTRFVVVASSCITLTEKPTRRKVSITFALKHESGSLHKVLALFAKSGLNLTKIESRNIPGSDWQYRFYLDFEGEMDKNSMAQILSLLEELTIHYKVLGYYQLLA